MQDFLPDVVEIKENERGEVVAAEEIKEKQPLNKTQIIRLAVVGLLGLLIILGVVVSILEKFGKKETENTAESLSERAKLIEKKPGRMSWLFYSDQDKDSVFDYEETVFQGISVSLRKPGEVQVLRTVPANALGQVIMDDLAEGEYEVSFDNYAKDEAAEGEFSFPGLYQVMQGESKFKEFLPSSWHRIDLDLDGYYQKIGVIDYEPESLLVFEDDKKVSLYDPKRVRVVGWSNIDLINPMLRNDRLFFLTSEDLQELSIGEKTVKPVMNWLYDLDDYLLSPGGEVIVYRENDEFRYKSLSCGEGSVLIDGYRLELKDGLVDFLTKDKLIVAGKLFEEENKVFQVVCSDSDFVARKILDSDVSGLVYLSDKAIFYSDVFGSYFYDLAKHSKVKYTALGSSVEVIASENKKYIGAIVGGKLMVVDYPAVVYSGVEKHYIIDTVNTLEGVSFSGDQVLVNQAKACEVDGDCGEIVRIGLKGSGVWKVEERVQLKDVKVDKVLGEIEF